MDVSWLLPDGKGIPVLMYHRVWPGMSDRLTITPSRLREHWEFLKTEGYRAISMLEYLEIATGKREHNEKVLLLTFDDGYVNNLIYAYPLLRELGWCATFFIIASVLDGSYIDMGVDASEKMQIEDLHSLDPAIVQLAMHGYHHSNMSKVGMREMEQELALSLEAFDHSGLAYQRVWAYPYGGRPEGDRLKKLKQMMHAMGITAAFRIGNKVSSMPAPDMYEIKRIDIHGTDTVDTLKIKIKKGKLRPF